MEYLNDLPAGLIGLAIMIVVYLGVYLLKRTKIVVTGDHARLANVILAAFFAVSQQEMSQVEQGLIALLASIGSAGIYELGKYLQSKK
jgi:hypothetical protein